MEPSITGIHHITAIASDPQRNVDFYTGVLGLRLVKLTVNFDDPGTYHLYYGDGLGRPGTILTFFPFRGAAPGRRGTGQVAAIAFAVPPSSLAYWSDRLARHGVRTEAAGRIFGADVLSFVDQDGLQLELVADPAAATLEGWDAGPVPATHAIRGLFGATLWARNAGPTGQVLTDLLGFRRVAEEGQRTRYAVGGEALGAWVDLVAVPDGESGLVARGTVHHIAWRTPSEAEQLAWLHDLAQQGMRVTPVQDRQYFRSIYFREPGEVLFEIATDPPGFAVDEAPESLGTHLKLPAWLESQRARIEQVLPPLRLPAAAQGV